MLRRKVFKEPCQTKYLNRLVELMNEQQALILTTTSCKHSQKGKQYLEEHNIEYKELALDRDTLGFDQMEVANCIYGKERRFVPFFMVDQQRIGPFYKLA